ncbi:MAG: hypothetical protein WC774_00035 [Candidatus Gracilibacteria bacterium]
MLYELTMQLAESEADGSISEAIIEGKKLQMKKLIEKNIINEKFAKEELVLIETIVGDAEKSLIQTFLGDTIWNQHPNISIPLTPENKEILRSICKQISILYLYRNDINLEQARDMLVNLTSQEDTSHVILHIEMHQNSDKIGRMYFIENG